MLEGTSRVEGEGLEEGAEEREMGEREVRGDGV